MLLNIRKYIVNGDSVKLRQIYRQLFVTLSISTTLLNYGLQSGWVSPMKKVLQSQASPAGAALTDNEISWIASGMAMAAIFGTPLYAYLADAYGRRIGIIGMIIPQLLCWIIKLISTHTIALMAARICAGLAAGGCFTLVPMYINEISQDNVRGAMVALAMVFINIGYLIMYAMGGYLNYYLILWIMIGITVVGGILFVAIAPESPAFLVKNEKYEVAAETVARLRGVENDDTVVQNQLDYMRNQEENFKTLKDVKFLSLFKNKAWLRGCILCTFNLTVLDMNGTLSINAYALTIMTQSGVTVNPELQTLVIPVVMIFGSLVSMSCVEKFGRKRILVGGLILSTVSLAFLASSLLLQQRGEVTVPGWLPVVAIVTSVWSYAAGVMPMIFVILSEMFTFQVRAKLVGVLVTYNWFVGFVQVYSYLPITNNFGMYTTFFIFASVNLIGAVVCLIFLPETMGKSVEEIEQMLLGKKLDSPPDLQRTT